MNHLAFHMITTQLFLTVSSFVYFISKCSHLSQLCYFWTDFRLLECFSSVQFTIFIYTIIFTWSFIFPVPCYVKIFFLNICNLQVFINDKISFYFLFSYIGLICPHKISLSNNFIIVPSLNILFVIIILVIR